MPERRLHRDVEPSPSLGAANRIQIEGLDLLGGVVREAADIQEGHVLVYGGADFPIRSAGEWPF